MLDIPSESVIELLSHRDNRASRIVSPFTVGDSDDESQTQREEDLRSCMDTASGADVPEATILDCVIGSFNTTRQLYVSWPVALGPGFEYTGCKTDLSRLQGADDQC